MRQRRRDGDQRHTHATNLFRHLSHECMCTLMKICRCDCARAMCRKMCVQQVSVLTSTVAHTVVATTWVRNPSQKKKKKQNSSLHDHLEKKKKLQFFAWVRNPLSFNTLRLHHSTSILIFPTRICSTNVLSTNHQMNELMLLGFPRHARLLMVDDVFVWTISNCVRAILAIRASLS